MESKLTGTQLKTYKSIFQHPVVHDLRWNDLHAMLGAVAELKDETNGTVKVTRNGLSLFLHAPAGRDVTDVEIIMKIRHFLDQSKNTPEKTVAEGAHMLVVIDHREARIFDTEMKGEVPQKITPHHSTAKDRYLHNVQDDANGQRRPENKKFYENVAATLKDAQQILVFGNATGAASAMQQLTNDLEKHHKEIAGRVIGWINVDEKHMSDNQLLAKAREVYEQVKV